MIKHFEFLKKNCKSLLWWLSYCAIVERNLEDKKKEKYLKVSTPWLFFFSLTPISLITRKSSKSKNIIWLILAATWESFDTKFVLLAKYWIIACESVTTNPSASTNVGTWCCLFIAKNCGVKCSLFSKSIFFNYNENYYVINHQTQFACWINRS